MNKWTLFAIFLAGVLFASAKQMFTAGQARGEVEAKRIRLKWLRILLDSSSDRLVSVLEDDYLCHRKLRRFYGEVERDLVPIQRCSPLPSWTATWRLTGETALRDYSAETVAIIEIRWKGPGIDYVSKKQIDLSDPNVTWLRSSHFFLGAGDHFDLIDRSQACDIAESIFNFLQDSKNLPTWDEVIAGCSSEVKDDPQIRRHYTYEVTDREIIVKSLRSHRTHRFDRAGPEEMNRRVMRPDLHALD